MYEPYLMLRGQPHSKHHKLLLYCVFQPRELFQKFYGYIASDCLCMILWLNLVQFWTKNDQTWQAWLFSKGSKMAYLKPILLPAFWTIFCPFRPSWPGKHKVYALKQIIIFLEYEEKTFLFVPLGQPYGFQFIPPLISNRG